MVGAVRAHMTDTELQLLLTEIESDRSERKQSASERDKIRQAICAFANDLPNHNVPGVLFVGARDDGSCASLPINDELLLTLSDMRSDGNIVPFPSVTDCREGELSRLIPMRGATATPGRVS